MKTVLYPSALYFQENKWAVAMGKGVSQRLQTACASRQTDQIFLCPCEASSGPWLFIEQIVKIELMGRSVRVLTGPHSWRPIFFLGGAQIYLKPVWLGDMGHNIWITYFLPSLVLCFWMHACLQKVWGSIHTDLRLNPLHECWLAWYDWKTDT